MNANTKEQLDALSSRIIASAFSVSNSVGAGFPEKVYENAMAVDFRSTGIRYVQQPTYFVRHRAEVVGEFVPDLVAEDAVIVEIKALNSLNEIHHAQCMNYLRVTGLRLALLINFGLPRVELKRVVMKF